MRQPFGSEGVANPGEVGLMHRERVPDGREGLAGGGDVVAIEVEADHLPGRPDGTQQLDGVPGPAEGAIDDDLAGPHRQRGEDFRQQDGNVPAFGSGAHGVANADRTKGNPRSRCR